MCPFKFIGHIWRQIGLGHYSDIYIPSKILDLPLIDNLGNPEEITKYYKSARSAI